MVQALLPAGRLAKIACGYTTVNSFFWPWITVRNYFQSQEHQQATQFG